MPITESESSLSTHDYDLLKTLKTNSVYSIVAHRYNLAFTRTQTGSDANNKTPDFDAIICNGFIYRTVSSTTLERYNIETDTWENVASYTSLAGAISQETVSLATDGTTLYAFSADNTAIYMGSTSDDGATWSGWDGILVVANVWRLSAASPTSVHYIVKDMTKLIFNLRNLTGGDSWVATASDIWLQHVPTNIAAVEYGTKEVLAIAVQVPGVNTVKTVNGTVVKYLKQSGGIIVFNYQYKSWSDHIEVDIIDELTAYRYRDRVKLSVINGRLFLTAYAADGTQQFPFTMYRMYTSEDGLWWSKGNAIPLAGSEGKKSGLKLLFYGDYVYGIERQQLHRSISTLATGHSPADMQVSLTGSKAIQEYNISQSSMFQSVIVLSNASDWLTDHDIIKKGNRILLVHKIGYRDPSTFVPIMVQVAVSEVDTVDFNSELPKHLVRLTSRDKLAWMTDRTAAERPYIWDSQLIGADDYSDYTATGYDGLRHSAQQSGAWSASGNKLILESSNVEGISFSTYSPYLWNGETQSGFALATAGNHEYAGVVFRAADKDNLFLAYYNQTTDKVELVERSSGHSTIRASSATLSWAASPTTTRWIRAEFRYARILIHTSTDGAVWTERISYLQSSVQPNASLDTRKMRGYVGFVGKGFAPAEESTWNPEPEPSGEPIIDPTEPIYIDPYTEPDYLGGIYPPITGAPPITGVALPPDGNTELIFDDTHLKLTTTGIILDTPYERDITPELTGDEIITDAKFDRYSPGAYCLISDGTDSRIAFVTNVGAYPLEWSEGTIFTGNFTEIELGDGEGKLAIKGSIGGGSTISVIATQDTPGVNTGLSFTMGDPIVITATGLWNYAGGFFGPDGDTGAPGGFHSAPGSNAIALIGRIGTTGSWFFVGSSLSTTAPATGILYLMMDDTPGFFGDNSGSLTVDINASPLVISTALSDDYGVTVSTPISITGASTGFDVQKAGNQVLVGGTGQTLKSDAGDAYADYGSPKNQGQIYIPRLLYGLSSLNDSVNPQYVLSATFADGSTHSLWRVSSNGDAFTNATPTSGGYPGLSIGDRTLIGHWMTSKHILGLFSFNGVIKFARTLDGGATWVKSAALDAGVTGIVTRRGDFDSQQVWWINGDKIAYCANYQLPTITFTERTFSLAEIKGFDVHG